MSDPSDFLHIDKNTGEKKHDTCLIPQFALADLSISAVFTIFETIFSLQGLGGILGLALPPIKPVDYADDVPLEGPKAKMVKKWSGNGFGPFQMTCPKSGQKVPKKWSKKGPRKIWDHKKTNFAWVFDKLRWRPSAATQKWARRPKAAAPIFGSLFVKTLSQIGVFMVPDFAGTLF